jgi:hypothetical protein
LIGKIEPQNKHINAFCNEQLPRVDYHREKSSGKEVNTVISFLQLRIIM